MLDKFKTVFIFSLFLILTACGSTPVTNLSTPSTSIPEQDATQPPNTFTPASPTPGIEHAPTESIAPIPSTPVVVIRDHNQARDAAMRHVTQTYNLYFPDAWNTEDLTPKNMLGESVFQYTTGPWVVRISAPVVALDQVIYTVVIDHLQSGLHWEGMVNAFGDIAQADVTPPAKVESPELARDQAVNYIQRKYGLSLPNQWTFIDTPQTMVGATRYHYTSDPWVVNVVAPASAPLASVYQVTVDNPSEKIKWQGEVTSQGTVTERSFTQGE
jgi:hypothetical protein